MTSSTARARWAAPVVTTADAAAPASARKASSATVPTARTRPRRRPPTRSGVTSPVQGPERFRPFTLTGTTRRTYTRRRSMTRLLLVIAAAGVLLAAAGAAGWWFFVREDNQLAASAPDIPEELVDATASPAPSGTTATPGSANSGSTVTYRINPELSEAAYFVDEELASLPLPSTAKGTTNEISGELVLTSDGAALAEGATSRFTVDLRNLTSDESRRDGRVQQALETSVYPTATFTITGVTGYDPAIPEGEEQSLQLTGTLDLHGVQREVTWEVKAKREGNAVSALATLTVNFADFGITPPTFAGLVSIDDKATLQVQLI